MTLAQLKEKLLDRTGTTIGLVLFDWDEVQSEVGVKTAYPVVLWSMTGSKFKKDIRTGVVQKTETITLSCYIMQAFDHATQNKITVWDATRAAFDVYLNKVNSDTNLSIENITAVEGEYYDEGGLNVDSEIGIGYKITLKTYC